MSKIDLIDLISQWIEEDQELSKHFMMSGHCIMDRCRNNDGIREPVCGRVYGAMNINGIHLYVGSTIQKNKAAVFNIVTLKATQPDFFERLRATIIEAHNRTQWCKTPIK